MLKPLSLVSAAAMALVVLAQPSEAKTRFSIDYLFDRVAPHPNSYFYDDEFVPEEDVEYDRSQTYDQFDANYYEPEVLVRPSVKPKLQATKPPVAAKKTTPKLALAKPDLPDAPKKSLKKSDSASGVTCAKATQIVTGYGFSEVKVKSCAGNIYAFTGTRSGKNYEISVSAARGDLTEVKRI
jgi:hypothetical protein